MRNLEPTNGSCNGTRLIVSEFSIINIDAEIATGVHKGKCVFILRIILTSPVSKLPFTLRRIQFPVRFAYCITISKGQGHSLKTVGIFLPSPEAIFSHGRLYVTLSRVTNPTGLKIMAFRNDTKSNSEVWVKKVVYREVFQSHHDTDNFPNEEIDELCSQLDDTFSSQITFAVHSAIAPVKGKLITFQSISNKLDELNSKTSFPHNDNEINSMDTDDNIENSVITHDCISDVVIQYPFDFSVYFSNGYVNNLTLRMRCNLPKN